MKRIVSSILALIIVAGMFPVSTAAASETTVFPAETNCFETTTYYVAPEKNFFDEILPEIEKNIKVNNTHTVTPYYDKFPLANNPENFQGLGHATYANINGKTVTAEAFYRVPNEGLNDPNYGLGILLYQCIQYKRAHPEEDVKITFSSYRTSASASVCVIPESKYYGYMRSLYTTNYDEQGFVRISFMLVEAARMGIEVTTVNQLNSYGRKQWDPVQKKLRTRKELDYYLYFNNALSTKCYDNYAQGKKVSDFFNFIRVGWKVNDITIDMQHLKSLSVTNYIATDGTEHGKSVFFSSSNLDDNFYNGANGNNGSQSGVIISDHDEIWQVTYNYTQLMARYSGQEDMYLLRNLVRDMNNEQYALIVSGQEDKIPEDEKILYLGSETDPVFELYFTPFGGGTDEWCPEFNPICKYVDKLQTSDSYIEFMWNGFGYGECTLGETMARKLEDAFCSDPDPLNKFSVRIEEFDTREISKLKVGSEIGYKSIGSNAGIHSKDIIMSYSENGVRHNVSLLSSCNYYIAAYYYRTNSMLVINEVDSDVPGFYDIFAKKFSYGATTTDFCVNPPELVLEKGDTYEVLVENNRNNAPLTWTVDKSNIAGVVNGKITAKAAGTATVTVTDGKNKDTVKLTVTDCIDCYNSKGLTCNTHEQYVLTQKYKEFPLTFEAVFSVDAESLTGTTAIIGSDGRFDPAIVFSLNKNGNPRLAIRNVADYSEQIVHTFSKVNVATGDRVHLAVSIDLEAKKIYCYVNGELQQTRNISAEFEPFEEKHNAVIGGDHRNGNATYFTGTIESVAVWSDVRTAEEIAADCKNGITVSDEKLMAAYNFLKCPEHFLNDLSANGNNLQHIALWQDKEDASPVGDFDYSFAVIGDTQTLCESDPEAMKSIYDWLLYNKDTQKIEYVLGLGDITDDSTDGEWEDALEAINKLNGKIPYSLARGNHDDWDDFNRVLHNGCYETTVEGMMNEGTVSLTDPSQPGLVPVMQEDGTVIYMTREDDIPEGGDVTGDLTNSYRTLSLQGTDYLIMTLDFAPSEAMLKWADSVIEAHPDHKVIITTHAYMYRDGTTISEEDCYPPTYYEGYEDPQNGDMMWEKCFSKHDNILMVLSGHDPWQHIVYRQDQGAGGNLVTQMLIDPQYVDRTNDSSAMVAMLYFSNEGRTLTVRYYSVDNDCYGSELSQFTIGLYNHEHEYTDIITPATLRNDGKIVSVCKECSAVEKEAPVYAPSEIALSEDNFAADGNAHKPSVTVKDKKGTALAENTDYTLTYSGDGISAGEYSVTVKFTGNYSGEKILYYTVNNPPEPEYSLGDVDENKSITAADARLALRASVNLETLTDIQKKAADINADLQITAADARIILRISVNLEKIEDYKK